MIMPDEIIRTVGKYFDTQITEFAVPETESWSLAHIKHVAMYLCCFNTRCSLKEIAAYFGKVHHTSVIRSREKIKKQLTRDCETKTDVVRLQSIIDDARIVELPLYDMNEFDKLFKAYASEKAKNRRLQAEIDELKSEAKRQAEIKAPKDSKVVAFSRPSAQYSNPTPFAIAGN